MVDLEALGDVIREERERQGMTQAELGRRVGLSRPSISLLERGSTKFPKIATLEAVATALGLALDHDDVHRHRSITPSVG